MHQPPAPPRAWRAAIVTVLLCLTSAAGAQADPISPPPALCKVPAAGTKLTAVFQPQVAIRDLATWFYSFSCKKLLFASDLGELSAQVTMIGSGRMTVKQATALFENALTAAGLKRTIKGDTWIITRDPKATSCAPAAPSLSARDVLAIDTTSAEARKANGIVAVDETHYTITRASFARLFDERSQLARGARVVPLTRDGKAAGFRLYAIRPTSLFAGLGFQNGDAIATIDGAEMTSAAVALAKYDELRQAKHFEVGILRRGKVMTLVYDVVD